MEPRKSVSYLLSRLTIAHRNLLEKTLAEIGLHSGQASILIELWQKDGQRQVDIAEKLNLAPPTVNKIINGMIESELVTRRKTEGDARSTRIYLTKTGKNLEPQVKLKWSEIEEQTLMGLTKTEGLILRQLLAKLLGEEEFD